jgi:hypothetical protein
MKKIPCLFVRNFIPRANGKGTAAVLTSAVTPGLEWVLEGKGAATRKRDGTACLIKDGQLYKRYDAKSGKPPPPLGIPCQPSPDETTGHWPHWIPVDTEPESKWHRLAFERQSSFPDGTYELCGPHFQGNPEGLDVDMLIPHGAEVLDVAPRSFEGLRVFLSAANIEGIVFWLDGEPRTKIRRDDYGLPWGSKGNRR